MTDLELVCVHYHHEFMRSAEYLLKNPDAKSIKTASAVKKLFSPYGCNGCGCLPEYEIQCEQKIKVGQNGIYNEYSYSQLRNFIAQVISNKADISDFDLSVHTFNLLKRADINTVSDFFDYIVKNPELLKENVINECIKLFLRIENEEEKQVSTEISADYIKAKDLDRRIKTSAQLAQQSLYDMCMGFKEMRDSKLYKELGYQNFESYCDDEAGIKHSQAYRFINIAENIPADSFPSMGRIGTTKLFLLSTLSEDDRTEITQTTDLENTSVKALEQQISELKKRAEEAEFHEKNISEVKDRYFNLSSERYDRIQQLEREIKELESRPIEVAVAEPSDDSRLLKETIKSLERENIRQNEELERSYREQEQDVRRMLENEKEQALAQLRKELADTKREYEDKLSQAGSNAVSDDELEYRAAMKSANQALNNLVKACMKYEKASIYEARRIADCFIEKIKTLED